MRSRGSLKKSNYEQIALVTLYKRAIVSKSILFHFFKKWREWFDRDSLFRSQKTSDSLEKIRIFRMFWQYFTAFLY